MPRLRKVAFFYLSSVGSGLWRLDAGDFISGPLNGCLDLFCSCLVSLEVHTHHVVGNVGANSGDAREPLDRTADKAGTVIAAHARDGQLDGVGTTGVHLTCVGYVIPGTLDRRLKIRDGNVLWIELDVDTVSGNVGADRIHTVEAFERSGDEPGTVITAHPGNRQMR